MFDKSYLPPAEARRALIGALSEPSLLTERLEIESCYGRVLAEEMIAPEDLPGFSRSTVDGYAVNAADTFGARETSPAYMALSAHQVVMGSAPRFSLQRGGAASIPTGGMLPEGADAVVMLEHVQVVSDDMIEVMRAVSPAENIISRGEDVRKGERVLHRGRKLRAQDIGALAGLGITSVAVFRRPVVAIISTGDEIVAPGGALGPGQVRDINSFSLWGLVEEHGGVPVKKGIIRDSYDAIRRTVEEALRDADIVLVSGGTSAGTKDMAAAIINDLGTPGVLFHGVSLKPGKPMIGGVIGQKPVLGLPGHPAAVVVCFDLFIRPLLEVLSGLDTATVFDKTLTARMAKAISSAAGREDHIRVRLQRQGVSWEAVPVLGKSGLITTLVKADGVVVIHSEKLGLDVGEEVTVWLF